MRGFGTVQFKKIGKQLVAFFLVLALLGGSGVMFYPGRRGVNFLKSKKAHAEVAPPLEEIKFSVRYSGGLYVPQKVYELVPSYSPFPLQVDHVDVTVELHDALPGSSVQFGSEKKIVEPLPGQSTGSSVSITHRFDPPSSTDPWFAYYQPIGVTPGGSGPMPEIYVDTICYNGSCFLNTYWRIYLTLYLKEQVIPPVGWGKVVPVDPYPVDSGYFECDPFFWNPYLVTLPGCPYGRGSIKPTGSGDAKPGLYASYSILSGSPVPSDGPEGGPYEIRTTPACPPPPPPSPFDLTFLGDLFAHTFSLQSSPDKIYAPNIVATSGAAPSFEPVVFGTVRSAVRIGNYTPNIDTQGQINAILTRLGKYKITKNSVSEAINYLNSNTTTQPPEGWIISVSGSGVETLTGVTITSGAKGTIILPSGKTLNITGNISYADDTASLAIVALDNSDPAIKVASSVTSLRGAYITLGGIQLPDKPIGVEGLLVGKDIKLPYPGNSSTFTYDHNLTENPPPGLREILNAIFKESAP